MKVLIQNCVTMRYLCTGKKDRWCDDTAKATDFGTSVVAIDYMVKKQLLDCQVFLSFGDPKLDIPLPVSETCAK